MKKISTLFLSLLCVTISFAQQKTYKMSHDGTVFTTPSDTVVFSGYSKIKGGLFERSVRFNNDDYKFVMKKSTNVQSSDLTDGKGNSLIRVSLKDGGGVVHINDGRELTLKRTNTSVIKYLNKDKDAAFSYYYDLDKERHISVTVRDSTLSPLLIELITLEQWAHEKKPFSGTGNAQKRNVLITSIGVGTMVAVIGLLADDYDDGF